MNLNIPLIRASFEEVKPIANEVVSFFYKTLFETYPASHALFEKTDLEKQKKALISSLVTIVDNLDKPSNLVSYLNKLGKRHIRYGVQEEHYSMVGKTLIGTFRHFFGANWTPELEDQWILAIGVIADHMLDGAKESQSPPAQAHDFKDLPQMIRQLARGLLVKVLEEEAEGEFLKLARKKASNALAEALRQEVDIIQEQFSSRKKAS